MVDLVRPETPLEPVLTSHTPLPLDTLSELHVNTSALWTNVKRKVVELLVKDEAMAADVTQLLSNVTTLNTSLHAHTLALALLTASHEQQALGSAVQISDTATQIYTKVDTAMEGLSRRADTMDGALGQLDNRLELSLSQVAANVTDMGSSAKEAVNALRLELTLAVQGAFTVAGGEHAAAVVAVVDSLHAVEAAAAHNLTAVTAAVAKADVRVATALAALEVGATANITSVVSAMNAMNASLTTHVGDVDARLTVEVGSMQNRHEALTAADAAVDARLGGLDAGLVTMETALLEVTISSAKGLEETMLARLATASANLTAHITSTSTTLENRLEGMAGDAASQKTALQVSVIEELCSHFCHHSALHF